MGFSPKNQLEWALFRAVLNPTYLPQLYLELLKSPIYLQQKNGTRAAGPVSLNSSSKLQLYAREIEGDVCLLAFTSLPRMQEGLISDSHYLRWNAVDAFRSLPDRFFVLNPYSKYYKKFSPEEIRGLLSGEIWQSIPSPSPIIPRGSDSSSPYEMKV